MTPTTWWRSYFGSVRPDLARTALVLLALSLFACEEEAPPPPSFDVTVKVESDPGTPVPGTRIEFQGKSVGQTGPDGVAKLRLMGADGQQFALDVRCPAGFTSPAAPLPVTLRRLEGGAGAARFDVNCLPSIRTVVVAVRVAESGANLPVMYLGQRVATTDEAGAAHVLLRTPPNQRIELTLDTSGSKAVDTASPSQTFEVRDSDEVFVFAPKLRKRAAPVVRAAKPSLPQPI